MNMRKAIGWGLLCLWGVTGLQAKPAVRFVTPPPGMVIPNPDVFRWAEHWSRWMAGQPVRVGVVGDTLRVSVPTHVLFAAPHTDRLRPEAYDVIHRIARVLHTAYRQPFHVTVTGHADRLLNPAAALRVTHRQAQAVATLMQANYPRLLDAMQPVQGQGALAPLRSRHSVQSRHDNRRIEWCISTQAKPPVWSRWLAIGTDLI